MELNNENNPNEKKAGLGPVIILSLGLIALIVVLKLLIG
jgi:hypothetical protein